MVIWWPTPTNPAPSKLVRRRGLPGYALGHPPHAPLWENMAQVRSVALGRDGAVIRPHTLRRRAQMRLAQLGIQAASANQETGRLSGGN
jgi:ABC-type sugar transport system ATPase subunit